MAMKSLASTPAVFMSAALLGLPSEALNVRSGKDVSSSNATLSSSVVEYMLASKLGSSTRDIADTFDGYVAESYGSYLESALICWAIFVGISALTACCLYKKGFVPEARLVDHGPKAEFQYGHYNCLSDSGTCFCSLVCPAVRWADSVSMFGYLQFWPAFLLFALLTLANTFARCPLLLGPFTAIGMAVIHQGMRKKVGLHFCTCGNFWPDCCLALFFPTCSIAQEARAAKLASQERLVGPAAKVVEGPPLSSASLTVQSAAPPVSVPAPAPDRLVITEDRPEGVYVAPPVIVSRGP